MLKKAGYTTGVVGKWHLGLGKGNIDWNKQIKPGPLEIGFDYAFIMPATADRVPCVFVENHRVANLDPNDPITVSYGKPIPGIPTGKTARDTLKMDWDYGHNGSIVNGISRIGYMKGGKSALWKDEDIADTFVEKGLSFIEKNKDKPFFLYFATSDIHVPRVPHPRFVGNTKMGPRGDAIVQFDWCVGQILNKLDKLGLAENTLVILTSDNGPVLNDGYKDKAVELVGSHKPAGPLRGWKYTYYEGGTRIPFITRWTGKIKPGTSDALISQVDLFASLAALTGQKLTDNDAPDSFNVLPALLGKSKQARQYVIEQGNRGLAIRTNDWKYIAPYSSKKNKTKNAYLYNIADDIAEKNNLITQYPEKAKQLKAMLDKIRKNPKSRP